jgi:hypothetical protein
MEDELQAARERRLQRKIDQMVADFRRDFKWPQGPVQEEQQQDDPPPEESKPSNVGKSRLKLEDNHPD